MGQKLQSGHIEFGNCDAENPIFLFDMTSTTAVPDTVKKGIWVDFILNGFLTQDYVLSNTNIYVEWDKTKLYSGDFPIGTKVIHA